MTDEGGLKIMSRSVKNTDRYEMMIVDRCRFSLQRVFEWKNDEEGRENFFFTALLIKIPLPMILRQANIEEKRCVPVIAFRQGKTYDPQSLAH